MKCKYFIFTVTFCFRDSLDAGDQNDSPPSSELDTAGAEPERAHEEVAEAGPSSQPQKKKKRKRVDGTPLQALLEEFKESRSVTYLASACNV